jgi:alanine racemase
MTRFSPPLPAPVPPEAAQAHALIDLNAVRESVATLVRRAGAAATMAVVKADGYGHGMLPCARAALEAGASWLGVTVIEEALALRAAGIRAPVLAWLVAPGAPVGAAIAAGVDLSAAAPDALAEIAAAAGALGRPARVHLKMDTGLGRGGATAARWPALCEAAAKLAADGRLEVVGVWSHLAFADAPGHPTVVAQVRVFAEGCDLAARHGLRPEVRHLANSAATLVAPQAHFDLVRPGISIYGLSPGPAVGTPTEHGLRPAMSLRGRLILVKRVPAGTGVSYAHRYVTQRETTLGLVPLGYADGVPRAATNTAEVLVAGARRRIAGTVCMDQFVVDLGDDEARAGDEVILFGAGDGGEPTAQDWADALETINYEIVARIGSRVPRIYLGESPPAADPTGVATAVPGPAVPDPSATAGA